MSVHKEALPSGRVSWVVKHNDPTGRQRTNRFPTRDAAKRYDAKVTHEVATGSWVDPDRGRDTLAAYAGSVIESMDIRRSTRERYRMHLRHIVGTRDASRWIGTRRIGRLTPADVRSFLGELRNEGVGVPTIKSVRQLLHRVCEEAVAEERIARNPVSKVPVPREEPREAFFLDEDQVARLAEETARHGGDAADGRYGTLVRFLGYSGLRVSEAAGLRVRNLDLMRGEVTVIEQITEVRGRAEPGKPKTKRGVRSVPIPMRLANELVVLVAGKKPDDYVFAGRDGGVLRGNNFRKRVLATAARRAGITRTRPDGTIEVPNVHDLRHTFAALAASAGFSIFEVSRMMGHESITTTANRYGHLFPDRRHEAHDRMEEMLRDAGAARAAATDAEVVALRP